MDSKIIHEVILTLAGEIQPVGRTEADEARLNNLKVITEVIDLLVQDVDDVAVRNKDRIEYSRKRAADFAMKFFDRLGIK